VIPLRVGHSKLGCNGCDGRVALGGEAVSFGIMIIFLSTLQHTSRTVAAIMAESSMIFIGNCIRRIRRSRLIEH